MKKVKVKIPAKINLTLDVLGNKDGYHEIESLVASVNVYDTVTVRKRRENFISVAFRGEPISVSPLNSNAYFAAKEFKKKYECGGVDILIERNIPAAAGLGGSSADIAGTLLALKKLFGVSESVEHIANKLGSDVAYMMHGGYAVMRNRGEKVEYLTDIKTKFHLLLLKGTCGVSTADCYAKYDELGRTYFKATQIATRFLREKDADKLFGTIKNDLYEGAKTITPEIEEGLNALKEFGAAAMTGSGSAIYMLFKTKKERDAAYKALFAKFGNRLIKAETV
ncbi:MAG: 4-(cytidine 5'-diphospho)-2-C-methyl-D-erythritol kinase [Clostridia bacterium]|nr:4-(cytidine 5'-diphospho)-2-C-methyl-D-erythritol kinase [Clostridia bacterium]